jgi:hypothetical protein
VISVKKRQLLSTSLAAVAAGVVEAFGCGEIIDRSASGSSTEIAILGTSAVISTSGALLS